MSLKLFRFVAVNKERRTRMSCNIINLKLIFLATLYSLQFANSNANNLKPSNGAVASTGDYTSQHLYTLNKAQRCCQKSNNEICQKECLYKFKQINTLQAFLTRKVKNKLLLEIESSCGQPFINASSDDMWHCLLESHLFNHQAEVLPHNITKTPSKNSLIAVNFGLNHQKWSCCDRSKSEICRSLCHKTFGNDWLQNWPRFQEMCIYSPVESRLRQCFEQTSQTCAFGCESKIQFCSFFFESKNNLTRAAWFRNCNNEADLAAKKTYQDWLFKGIVDHLNSDLVSQFADHLQCEVDVVKLLACAIHLKPCLPQKHSTEICMFNDCRIQNECIDWQEVMKNETHLDQTFNDLDVPRLCLLGTTKSFNNNSQSKVHKCYTINHYSDPDSLASDKRKFVFFSQTKTTHENMKKQAWSGEVSNTCYQSSCTSESQMCIRNDQCTWTNCSPCRCQNICRIGKLKEMLVLVNNYYQIPQLEYIEEKSSFESDDIIGPVLYRNHHNCFHLCRCDGIYRQPGKCYFYCLNQTDETLVNEIFVRLECLQNCVELKEDLIKCKTNFENIGSYNCTKQCFHNQHVTCNEVGLTPIICTKNNKCVVETGTQLIALSSVNGFRRNSLTLSEFCINQSESVSVPVCDNYGNEYRSLCNLHLRQSQLTPDGSNLSLAYLGKCQIHCSPIGEICGRDGRDYKSECAANFEHVLVDRYSSCQKESRETVCREADLCPNNEFVHNIPFNQCGFCGSVVYFYYDFMFFLRMSTEDRVNIMSVLVEERMLRVTVISKQLNNMITVGQCKLYAHLISEGLLAVMIKPNYVADKELLYNLHQICQQELIRLTTLIKNNSPAITSLFPSSLLRYNQEVNDRLVRMASKIQQSKSNSNFIDLDKILILVLIPFSFCLFFQIYLERLVIHLI